jgi:hypothetical protein
MQDDQAKSADGVIKNDEDSAGSTGDLTLSGKSSSSSDSSIPDPALEALEDKQQEQPADTSQPAEETAPSAESKPPAPSGDNLPEPGVSTGAPSTSTDEVLDPIKKEALQKLEPLVSELDLHPEEKYRALMMIIQATDNKDLVNEAYQAADKIEDNKTRAQALLSIVNEIEYFKNKEIASSD